MTPTTPFGTLGMVAGRLDEKGVVLERARLFSELWPGPIALIVLGGIAADQSETLLPDAVRLIAAGGDVAAALAKGQDTPQSLAAFAALEEAAAAKAPLVRHYVLGENLAPGLLPVIAESSFPCPVDLELPPGEEIPDTSLIWPWCDSLVVSEKDQVYPLSSGTPALPVRFAPLGETMEAGLGLAALPFLGGPKRISVVVPVRGQAALVSRMVASVIEHTVGLLEVILIDDASPDRTRPALERLAATDSRIRLMVQDSQHGFAATCNHGLAAARGDVVFVLNADTVVTPGWADRLINHLDEKPKAGAAGPLSNRVAPPQQLDNVAYDQKSLNGLSEFSEKLAMACAGRASAVVRLSGLCLAIHRRALRRVGGFDPRFFPGNCEDDDWGLRVLGGGLFSYRAEDVFIHHEGSKSFALEPRAYRAILEDNWKRFCLKWGLPAERSFRQGYNPDEFPITSYDRGRHFIAPWLALQPTV